MANILANLDGWDIIPANNQPDALDPMTVVDDLRQIQATVKKYLASRASTIASAATVDLSAATGSFVEISGTTTITSFGTIGGGITKLLKFTGALQLTYNATSMILPTEANLTTGAGDTALFVSLGSGNWQCVTYQRASGQSVSPHYLPVGSIYINRRVSTNPATLLGYGVWARITPGVALVSLDESNPIMDTVGETFGQADAILPSHTHTVNDSGHSHVINATAAGTLGGGWFSSGPYSEATANVTNSASSTTGITIAAAGISATDKNYQPSIAVYMWERTS